MNILMVDDDPEDIEIFSSLLAKEDKSIQFNSASDGQEGINFLLQEANIPDFIFLDLNMPAYDGYYFLETIKSHSHLAHIPVIIYSTSSHQTDIKRTKQMGALHYVTKPSDLRSLSAIIRATVTGTLSTAGKYVAF